MLYKVNRLAAKRLYVSKYRNLLAGTSITYGRQVLFTAHCEPRQAL